MSKTSEKYKAGIQTATGWISEPAMRHVTSLSHIMFTLEKIRIDCYAQQQARCQPVIYTVLLADGTLLLLPPLNLDCHLLQDVIDSGPLRYCQPLTV